MKILKKILDKDRSGTLTIETQDDEDVWHVYNLLAKGDCVTTSTTRKVVKTSSTGSTTSTKKQVILTIEITEIEFDSGGSTIRIKGKTVNNNEFVKRGVFHTLTIDNQTTFQLQKNDWDTLYLERIAAACDSAAGADVAAVVLQSGLGYVCLITKHRTLIRAKVDISIPKKRVGSSDRHKTGVERFHGALKKAIDTHINFNVVKCLIIASPAHFKDDFVQYYLRHITNERERQTVKPKICKIQSSSGYLHSLSEVMQDVNIKQKIENTKAFKEMAALERFFDLLNNKPDWAWFGPQHCKAAASEAAVEILLVSDDLFRSASPKVRQDYVGLVDEVKSSGGEVFVFSSLHVSGQQLNKMSGVAAILRTPMAELQDLEGRGPDDYDSEDEEDMKRLGLI